MQRPALPACKDYSCLRLVKLEQHCRSLPEDLAFIISKDHLIHVTRFVCSVLRFPNNGNYKLERFIENLDFPYKAGSNLKCLVRLGWMSLQKTSAHLDMASLMKGLTYYVTHSCCSILLLGGTKIWTSFETSNGWLSMHKDLQQEAYLGKPLPSASCRGLLVNRNRSSTRFSHLAGLCWKFSGESLTNSSPRM